MKTILSFLLLITFVGSISAFSTTNVQYLYGNFSGNSGFDTIGGKSTVTIEHFSTYDYGDFYSFADLTIADDRFKTSNKSTDLYFELSPRVSLSKTTGKDLSFLFIKDIFLSAQYNRQIHKYKDFDAWLYGIGVNLKVQGLDVFGLNFYKKDKNLGNDTYQATANYISNDIFNTKFTINGFTDWTTQDILSQNKLLYKLDYSPLKSKVSVGTEWHYYKVKNSDVQSNILQAIIMLVW